MKIHTNMSSYALRQSIISPKIDEVLSKALRPVLTSIH